MNGRSTKLCSRFHPNASNSGSSCSPLSSASNRFFPNLSSSSLSTGTHIPVSSSLSEISSPCQTLKSRSSLTLSKSASTAFAGCWKSCRIRSSCLKTFSKMDPLILLQSLSLLKNCQSMFSASTVSQLSLQLNSKRLMPGKTQVRYPHLQYVLRVKSTSQVQNRLPINFLDQVWSIFELSAFLSLFQGSKKTCFRSFKDWSVRLSALKKPQLHWVLSDRVPWPFTF